MIFDVMISSTLRVEHVGQRTILIVMVKQVGTHTSRVVCPSLMKQQMVLEYIFHSSVTA